jgi:hypothetical protein
VAWADFTVRELSGNYLGFGMGWLGWASLAGWLAGWERLGLGWPGMAEWLG